MRRLFILAKLCLSSLAEGTFDLLIGLKREICIGLHPEIEQDQVPKSSIVLKIGAELVLSGPIHEIQRVHLFSPVV